VRIGAYYDDRYVELAGAWKIAHHGAALAEPA